MKFFAIVSLLFSVNQGLASTTVSGCLPDSNLRFDASGYKGLEQREKVDEVIAEFKKVFAPIVKTKMNRDLKIINQWDEGRVNAHATKDKEDNPVIILNGGMVRHPDMKKEGIYFILCHELGHFFGGAPRQFRGRSEIRSWSSAEGQADYYAATKCLPKLFNHLALTGEHDNLVADPTEQKEVDKICNDRNCSKVLLAGLSATKVFASLKPWWKVPNFNTPNRSRVGITDLNHPEPQCRLDTIVSGSLCDNSDEDFHPTNPSVGACVTSDPQAKVTGTRPSCWYKAESSFE